MHYLLVLLPQEFSLYSVDSSAEEKRRPCSFDGLTDASSGGAERVANLLGISEGGMSPTRVVRRISNAANVERGALGDCFRW